MIADIKTTHTYDLCIRKSVCEYVWLLHYHCKQ